MTRDPAAEALLHARAVGDWETLWHAGLPLVRVAARQLQAAGSLGVLTEDLLQAGHLAVGEAVRRWDPLLGAFSTFIVATLRGKLLEAQADGLNGGITDLPEGSEADPDHDGAYLEAPEGYRDPAVEFCAVDDQVALRFAVDLLPADERAVVSAVYGLDGERLTADEFARLTSATMEQVKTVKARAIARLREIMA